MYLFLGGETTVNTRDLLGIFDLDSTTLAASTRSFLQTAQRENRVVNTSAELPKSFVVGAQKPCTVFVCQPGSATLKKRLESPEFGGGSFI